MGEVGEEGEEGRSRVTVQPNAPNSNKYPKRGCIPPLTLAYSDPNMGKITSFAFFLISGVIRRETVVMREEM